MPQQRFCSPEAPSVQRAVPQGYAKQRVLAPGLGQLWPVTVYSTLHSEVLQHGVESLALSLREVNSMTLVHFDAVVAVEAVVRNTAGLTT